MQYYPLGTRRCYDVESTPLTLIQRRNNVMWPVGTIIGFTIITIINFSGGLQSPTDWLSSYLCSYDRRENRRVELEWWSPSSLSQPLLSPYSVFMLSRRENRRVELEWWSPSSLNQPPPSRCSGSPPVSGASWSQSYLSSERTSQNTRTNH